MIKISENTKWKEELHNVEKAKTDRAGDLKGQS